MKSRSPIVGILDLQGDVIEHRRMLKRCGATVVLVKTVEDLGKVQALILPGGESTAIGKLLHWYELAEPLKQRVRAGMPVYATCAGLILLAKKNVGQETAANLGLMDITVERNSYGRQMDSFETLIDVRLNKILKKIPAVFIRAPRIKSIGKACKILAYCERDIVLVQEKNKLVSSFHPELTQDLTIHRYFLSLI